MLQDRNGIADSLVMLINDIEILSGSSGLSLIDSILTYLPSVPLPDTLIYSIIYAADTLGNSFSSSEYYLFYDLAVLSDY